MADIKRILVPINGTEQSIKALKFATKLARIYDAQIDLLLVTYFDEDTDDGQTSWLPTPLTTPVAKYKHNVFTQAQAFIPADLSVKMYQESGQPQEKILEFMNSHHSDMVVIGSRNLKFFGSIIQGSVSRQILEKAKCSVIIVK